MTIEPEIEYRRGGTKPLRYVLGELYEKAAATDHYAAVALQAAIGLLTIQLSRKPVATPDPADLALVLGWADGSIEAGNNDALQAAVARIRAGFPAFHPTYEGRAKALRQRAREVHPNDYAPDTSPAGLRQTATMLETYGPECFPANEHGQIPFARAMMESAADALNAAAERLSPAAPAATDGAEACIACDKAFQDGEAFYPDTSGGFIHASCCVDDPESFTDSNGDPLQPSDPIPPPQIWTAEERQA